MPRARDFFSALVTCLLCQTCFSYPYPIPPPMRALRRHLPSSGSAQTTWIPYPMMLPPLSPKFSMHDYARGSSVPFMRPPAPPTSPLLPSSSFMVPSVAPPPQSPSVPPPEKIPQPRASDRSSHHPPARNKPQQFRDHQPRTKTIPDYVDKDFDDQEETKWSRRFNRIDDSSNFREGRHNRRHFGRQQNRRNFEDSDERIRDERVFPGEREDNSRETEDDRFFRRTKPMIRPRHDFRRPKQYRDSDELGPVDRYSSREYNDKFFSRGRISARSDKYPHPSEQKFPIMPKRRPTQYRPYDSQNSRNHQTNSRNQQHGSNANFHMQGSKLHKGRDQIYNENSLTKHNRNKDSDEVDSDYSKKATTRRPIKKIDPVKVPDYDSAELPWSYEESAERKTISKPNINEDKSKANKFTYRDSTKKQQVDTEIKTGSSEEYETSNRRSGKLDESSPSTARPKSSTGYHPQDNSAEESKKESWNWSSTEIVVKDDEGTDTNSDNENYDNYNHENTPADDKEETEIVDSGSEILKINNSKRETVEKSYMDDSSDTTSENTTTTTNSTAS